MKTKKSNIVILLILVLQGCALFGTTKTTTNTVIEPFSVIHPTAPDQIKIREVKFKILSSLELEKLLERLTAMEGVTLTPEAIKIIIESIFGQDAALYALNNRNYESLGLNMQEIKRYIAQQKEIVIYYKTNVPSPSDVLGKEDKGK